MVQTQLGHSDPALTLRLYQHLFEDDLDARATRLDFNFRVEATKASDLSRPVDGLGSEGNAPLTIVNAATSTFEAPSA
jgi:hypothetical protein